MIEKVIEHDRVVVHQMNVITNQALPSKFEHKLELNSGGEIWFSLRSPN